VRGTLVRRILKRREQKSEQQTTRTRRLEKSKEDFQGEAIVRHVNDRTKHYDNDSQVEWRPKDSRGMDLQVHSSMYLEDSGRSSLYESDQGGIRERIAY